MGFRDHLQRIVVNLVDTGEFANRIASGGSEVPQALKAWARKLKSTAKKLSADAAAMRNKYGTEPCQRHDCRSGERSAWVATYKQKSTSQGNKTLLCNACKDKAKREFDQEKPEDRYYKYLTFKRL